MGLPILQRSCPSSSARDGSLGNWGLVHTKRPVVFTTNRMMGGETVTCLQSEGSEGLGDGLSEIVAEYAFFQSYVSSVFF